jgi:hypothetical protein
VGLGIRASGGFGPADTAGSRIENPSKGSQAGMRLTARSQALCISVSVPVLWQESKTYNGSYGSRVLDAAGPGSRPEYTHLRMPFFRIFSLLGGLYLTPAVLLALQDGDSAMREKLVGFLPWASMCSTRSVSPSAVWRKVSKGLVP